MDIGYVRGAGMAGGEPPPTFDLTHMFHKSLAVDWRQVVACDFWVLVGCLDALSMHDMLMCCAFGE